MRLYKTIDGDWDLINRIKAGEYENCVIVFENDLFCDVKEKQQIEVVELQ